VNNQSAHCCLLSAKYPLLRAIQQPAQNSNAGAENDTACVSGNVPDRVRVRVGVCLNRGVAECYRTCRTVADSVGVCVIGGVA